MTWSPLRRADDHPEGRISMGKAKRAAALAGITVALLVPAGAAHAEECLYPANCQVKTEVDEQVRADAVTSQPAAAASGGTLPVTGGDAVGLAVIGAGAVAVGALLVRRSRRSAA
jgi:LPXTG-motif cell wall-anchored protein